MRYAWQDSVDRALAYQRPQGRQVRHDKGSWNEADHPRGQPKNAGQFAVHGAGSFRPTGGSAGGPGTAAKTGQREGRYASSNSGEQRPAAHATSSQQHRAGHHPPSSRGKTAGPRLKTSQREGRAPTSQGPHGSFHKMIGHTVRSWSQEDYELLHETFNKVSQKERRSVGNFLKEGSKGVGKFLVNHVKEESLTVGRSVGALAYLSVGKTPTPNQMKGVKRLTLKLLLSGASFVAFGDPTGAAAHGVGALAQEFGHDIMQHVVFEHAAQTFLGVARGAKHAAKAGVSKVKQGAKKVAKKVTRRADAANGDDDPDANIDLQNLTPEQERLLSEWILAVAEAIETIDESTAEKILADDANADVPPDLGLDDDEDEADDKEDEKSAPKGRQTRQDNQLVRDFNEPFAWMRYVENLIGPFQTGLDKVDDEAEARQDDASTWDESKVNRVPEGSSEGGQFAPQGGAGGGGATAGEPGARRKPASHSFVSPSVGENLDFSAATGGLTSKRQRLLETTSRDIDSRLGILSRNLGAIGAWTDGAENSIMTETEDADWETLKVAVAMKAFLANQKAALIFQEVTPGSEPPLGSERAHLYSFTAKGNLDKIHQDLLSDGIENHSIIPTKGGATVYAVDLSGGMEHIIAKAAQRYGAEPTVQFGNAQFIGNNEGKGANDHEQRHKARLAYRGIIEKTGVPGAEAIWKRVRPTYLRGFQVGEYQGETTEPLAGSAPGSHPATIASVFPTAVKIIPGDKYRRADLDGMKGDAEVFRDNMNLLKNAYGYPNLRPVETRGKAPDTIAKAAKEMAKKNLRFLWEHATDEIRRDGPLWYEGAHRMAKAQAERYGIPVQSMAGVYASLSPQKLWDQNVRLGDKLVDIYHNHQDTAWSPEMADTAAKIWKAKDRPLLARIEGKTLSELQLPAEKAMWIRTYDEAHNSQQFDRLSPDGRNLGTWVNLDGKPAANTWQNTYAIANAVIALESGGNREVLSLAMGQKNKVRSFYNNILDPHSANHDVTMDTHAVGAVLLRPETQKSTSVLQALATNPKKDKDPKKDKTPPGWKGARSSNKTGSSGTYGLWGDAYRELADELGIEPRVLQSVTWVVKRQLFDDRMTEATRAAVEAAWQGYHAGVRSFEDTQAEVWRLAGGIESKPPAGVADPEVIAAKAAAAERKAARAAKGEPPEPEEDEEVEEEEEEEEDA